jgi:hypothetical protein
LIAQEAPQASTGKFGRKEARSISQTSCALVDQPLKPLVTLDLTRETTLNFALNSASRAFFSPSRVNPKTKPVESG